MYTLFLLLLLTSLSQTSIPVKTLDSDAAELYGLSETLKSYSPAIIHRSQSLVCEMINSCCPFIKPRLAEHVGNMVTTDSSAMMTACMDDQPPQSFVNSCPMISKFLSIAQDPDLIKFGSVLGTATAKAQIFSIDVQRPCSSEEAYAALCDWTQRNLVISCERKTLLYVAQHNNDNDYRTFVQVAKNNLRSLTNAFKSAFVVENSTGRTLTSSTQVAKVSSSSAQKSMKITITLLALLVSLLCC